MNTESSNKNLMNEIFWPDPDIAEITANRRSEGAADADLGGTSLYYEEFEFEVEVPIPQPATHFGC